MASEIRTLGIVGAGTMGSGIAQVALEAGHRVTLHDQAVDVAKAARDRIEAGLRRRAAKDGHPDPWVDACLAGLELMSGLEDAVATADLVIEAATEDLSAKQSLVRGIAAAAPASAILATNTSALSVTAIGAATPCPERVIGLHFFNPAPVMRLVEVVTTAAADPAIVERAMALMTAWGKTPVRCRDSPGFIVNRVNRPFTIEALRMLEAGEADVPVIDAAMRAAGFPMGPFELMDLIGIDVNLAAARGVYEGLGRPEHLRPSPIQERLVAEGHLGRKAGEGFYRYDRSGDRLASVEPIRRVDPGLADREIAERIIGAIDAEARIAAAEGVAAASDIELALRLGAGHPSRTAPLR